MSSLLDDLFLQMAPPPSAEALAAQAKRRAHFKEINAALTGIVKLTCKSLVITNVRVNIAYAKRSLIQTSSFPT